MWEGIGLEIAGCQCCAEELRTAPIQSGGSRGISTAHTASIPFAARKLPATACPMTAVSSLEPLRSLPALPTSALLRKRR